MGRILLFCILAIVSTWTWGKEDTVNTSSDIQAYISYCSFMAPGQGPYLEVYYTVNSNSITYKRKENGQLQGRLSVTYMLLHQDTVYKYDKFRIHTPAVDSLQNIDFSIVDQRRTSVQPGRYRLRVRITDSYDTSNTTYVDMPVHVNYSNDTVEISDIELVDRYQESKANSRFTKNNYDIYPLVANFLPTQRKQLTFYAEIYNTDKIFSADKQFLVRYSIKESNSDKVVDRLSQFNKKSPSPVNVLFANLDISTLSTGNYELCVQVRNRKNKKVAEKRLFFQRVNRKMRDSVKKELKHVDVEDTFVDTITGDDMDYHLNAIYPIADKREMGVIKTTILLEFLEEAR